MFTTAKFAHVSQARPQGVHPRPLPRTAVHTPQHRRKTHFWGGPPMEPMLKKSGIPDNSQILEVLAKFYSFDYVEKIRLLSFLYRSATGDNSALVLSFLLNLAGETIEVPALAFRSLEFHFQKLRKKLEAVIAKECRMFLGQLTKLTMCESAGKDFDEHEYLVQSIVETLITCSTREIENMFKNFYEPKSGAAQGFSIQKFFLRDLQKNWAELSGRRRLPFMSLAAGDLPHFMLFLQENPESCQLFLFSAYFFNMQFYAAVEDAVYADGVQALYSELPRIDVRRINAENMRFDIFRSLLVKRPGVRDTLLDMLASGGIYYEKKAILGLVAEVYEVFAGRLARFVPCVEDMLRVARANEDAVPELIANLDKFDEAGVQMLSQLLQQKDDAFVKRVFAPAVRSRDGRVADLINSYLLARPLPEGQRSFFLESLGDNPDYFYSLMPYFKREKNLESIGTALVDERSLVHFLRVFTLNELFYLAHYVPDLERAKKIAKLCIDSEGFGESVVMFAVPKMELDKLPPLFMWSIILSYMKLPTLKGFVVNLLHKLVKRAIWQDMDLFEGFIKALEAVGNESVDVLVQMPAEQITRALKRSEKLVGTARKHLSASKGMRDRDEKKLRNALISMK